MEKDIGKIKKNDTTDIIVRIDHYGGKKGLTIREYTTSERYTGFTKSGTRIPAEFFLDFKQMINSIDEKDLESDINSSIEPKPSEKKTEENKKQKKKKVEEEIPIEEF
jgi:hypothetical protein